MCCSWLSSSWDLVRRGNGNHNAQVDSDSEITLWLAGMVSLSMSCYAWLSPIANVLILYTMDRRCLRFQSSEVKIDIIFISSSSWISTTIFSYLLKVPIKCAHLCHINWFKFKVLYIIKPFQNTLLKGNFWIKTMKVISNLMLRQPYFTRFALKLYHSFYCTLLYSISSLSNWCLLFVRFLFTTFMLSLK